MCVRVIKAQEDAVLVKWWDCRVQAISSHSEPVQSGASQLLSRWGRVASRTDPKQHF